MLFYLGRDREGWTLARQSFEVRAEKAPGAAKAWLDVVASRRATRTASMQKLNESPVTLDQIDSLGHLNVRYYIARMDLANRQLLEANGVSGDEHTFLRRVDTITSSVGSNLMGRCLARTAR